MKNSLYQNPSGGPAGFVLRSGGWLHSRNLLARGDLQDGVPHELCQPIKRVLTKPFDIAVPPMLGELGFVETRSDAVSLHALRAQLREIGRASHHTGNGDSTRVEATL